MSMYDRAFGIEFELGTRRRVRDSRLRNLLDDGGFRKWSLGYDGTEYEIKTPPLRGPNGWKQIKNFLDLMKSPDINAYVTRSDGLHVHHDAPEFIHNSSLVKRLVENWMNNQDNILKIVHPRRVNSSHCPQWSDRDYNYMTSLIELGNRPNNEIGRKNLNIRALYRHGTIEFRCHEGTLEYDEILSWVRFGQAFLDRALNEEGMPATSDIPELLQNVRVSRFANRFLPEKARQMSLIDAW